VLDADRNTLKGLHVTLSQLEIKGVRVGEIYRYSKSETENN